MMSWQVFHCITTTQFECTRGTNINNLLEPDLPIIQGKVDCRATLNRYPRKPPIQHPTTPRDPISQSDSTTDCHQS
ncbi:hypothetical protein FJTKL_03391 [Diaporthe vaccinii]|uniref:Uncharacterized protein n=1 Tax=Diaporthe vaccinii TaxID=105482 RepID=A0ABR4F210_9PEZI